MGLSLFHVHRLGGICCTKKQPRRMEERGEGSGISVGKAQRANDISIAWHDRGIKAKK